MVNLVKCEFFDLNVGIAVDTGGLEYVRGWEYSRCGGVVGGDRGGWRGRWEVPWVRWAGAVQRVSFRGELVVGD